MKEAQSFLENIFHYSDYRQFLRDYFSHAKQINKNYSYRFFAREASILAPNLLHYIINGKKNLTEDFFPKFVKAMGLNKREQKYFNVLISYDHSKDEESKKYYWDLLQSIKEEALPIW